MYATANPVGHPSYTQDNSRTSALICQLKTLNAYIQSGLNGCDKLEGMFKEEYLQSIFREDNRNGQQGPAMPG